MLHLKAGLPQTTTTPPSLQTTSKTLRTQTYEEHLQRQLDAYNRELETSLFLSSDPNIQPLLCDPVRGFVGNDAQHKEESSGADESGVGDDDDDHHHHHSVDNENNGGDNGYNEDDDNDDNEDDDDDNFGDNTDAFGRNKDDDDDDNKNDEDDENTKKNGGNDDGNGNVNENEKKSNKKKQNKKGKLKSVKALEGYVAKVGKCKNVSELEGLVREVGGKRASGVKVCLKKLQMMKIVRKKLKKEKNAKRKKAGDVLKGDAGLSGKEEKQLQRLKLAGVVARCAGVNAVRATHFLLKKSKKIVLVFLNKKTNQIKTS